MGCVQGAPSVLTPPREGTPKAPHLPMSKLLCSNAPDPESPSHGLSPETNSLAVSTCLAEGSEKQSVKDVSFGMQVSSTFSLMRLVPADMPVVSVGVSMP